MIKQRERLQTAKLTIKRETMIDNKYLYDAVDKIRGISNVENPQSINKYNLTKLGGMFSHT